MCKNDIHTMRKLVILLLFALLRAQGQNASGDSVIFNISSTANAGDVIYIQGSGFGSSPQVQYAYNDSNWVSLSVITSGSNTAMVQLPSSQSRLPDLVTIRVSSNGSNWSTPVFLNQAKALSFDTTQVGPGSQFRIFGRNLIFSRTPTVRLVDSADGSSHQATINASSSKAYMLVANASTDIKANHTYSIYVSNGYNGNGSTGGETLAPVTLQGRASGGDYWQLGVTWSADLNFTGNVYNVQTDHRLTQHATGSGSALDISVINQAMWDAHTDGGGIVYLPPGVYDLYYSSGCGLSVPSRVVLMGGGVSNTHVNFGFGAAPSASAGGWAICFVGASESGASDITFTNVNQSGHWPQSAVGLNSTEIFLQRTTWNIGTSQWLTFQNNAGLAIENSGIYQGLDPSYNGPFSLQTSSNVELKGNTIKYVAGTIDMDSASGVTVENNNIIRDASQSAPSGVISHVIVGNFANNLMFLNNTFNVTGGTLPTTNDGETIGEESGGQVRRDEFRGTVGSAGSNYIYDASQNFNTSTNNAVPNLHVGSILAIVSGTGAGQWATVAAISSDGHTATVNKNWAVIPTYGSTYATFDWGAANWIIAGNTMSNNEKGIEFWSSSIRDILITNNTMTNNGEILVSPDEAPVGSSGLFNFVINTQVLNNTLTDSDHLRPAAISAVSREDDQDNNLGTAIIGFEARNNTINAYTPNTFLSNISLDDAKALSEGFNIYWQWQTTWSSFEDNGTPSILGTVLQGNTLNNSSSGYELNSGDSQTVLAENTLNNVGTIMTDVTISGDPHASVATVTVTSSGPVLAPHQVSGSTAPNVWNQVTVGSLPTSSLSGEPATVTSFSLAPSVYQIGNGPDSLSMLAQAMPTDGTFVARITMPSGANPAAEGVLTLRSSGNQNAAFVSFGQLQNGSMIFQYRAYDGGGVGGYSWPVAIAPVWVKLVKSGNLIQGFYSADGESWNYGGEVGVAFYDGPTYLAGLESLSNSTSGPAITFDNVQVP